MYILEMKWKEFNVNLEALDTKLRAEHASYKGNQAHRVLGLIFDAEPAQEDKEAIQAYWEALDVDSDIVKSYKTREEIKTAADAAKAAIQASASAKLAALGLTADEIAAIRG